MTINKHNYEAYFLDYHEGNLTPQEVADLLLFVEQHPELKDEFESFENVTLEDYSTPSFENKDILKKEINQENVEEYFIKDVEGVITSVEKTLLHNYIKQHPQLSADLELYRNTKLSADSSLVFGNKKQLKEIPFVLASKNLSDMDELMIASIEGVLSGQEQLLLRAQLQTDASLSSEFSLYKKAILLADTTIVYNDKDELKRTSKKAIPFYYYVSAAAAILLLFGLFSVFNKDSVEPKFATNNTAEMPPVANNNSVVVSDDIGPNQEKDAVAEKNSNRVVLKRNTMPKKQNDSQNESVIIPSQLENLPKNAIANNTTVLPEMEQKNNQKQSVDNNLALKNTTTLALTESAKPDDYMSLKEMAVAKIKEKTMDETVLDSQKKSGRMKKMSGWDLAQIVAKGISKITGKDINVEPTYNDAGDVTAYALNAGKLGFSRGR
jgi:mRNA-degrading endonuclease YafQ of YafQ-DinJ toxin-antitoxin module